VANGGSIRLGDAATSATMGVAVGRMMMMLYMWLLLLLLLPLLLLLLLLLLICVGDRRRDG